MGWSWAIFLLAAGQDARPVLPLNLSEWITDDDYPEIALQRGEHGDVGFSLTVNPSGQASDCTIISSSGSDILDLQTCSLLKERARFRPAMDPSGKPIEARFTSRLRWALPSGPAAAPALATITLPNAPASKVGASDVTVDANGFIEKCEPVPRPYENVFGPPDLCAMYPPGGRFSPPAQRNGHPQRRRVRVTITTQDTYIK